jgi:hypothetical protein
MALVEATPGAAAIVRAGGETRASRGWSALPRAH